MKTKPVEIPITQQDLAALIGVTTFTIRKWAKKGLIKRPVKLNGQCLYSLRDIKASVDQHCLRCNLDALNAALELADKEQA